MIAVPAMVAQNPMDRARSFDMTWRLSEWAKAIAAAPHRARATAPHRHGNDSFSRTETIRAASIEQILSICICPIVARRRGAHASASTVRKFAVGTVDFIFIALECHPSFEGSARRFIATGSQFAMVHRDRH
jgi:hypothetical protein